MAILGLAVAATIVALNARGPELALEVTKLPREFSPVLAGRRQVEPIHFYVRQADPNGRVEIIDSHDQTVRTLADPIDLQPFRPVRLQWNGRTDSGRAAPSGFYRLRVVEPAQKRDMVFPIRIELLG